MSAILSSDATFSMEMFPFGHCPEGNGDVSSVCFVRENNNSNNNNNNNNNNKDEKNKDGGDELDNVKTDGGLLNLGKGLAISMVDEAWLSEKKEV
ncbi:hypothetical protein Tco_0821681 [Tanacetum coccineum]|uniref:Uncharacterized protein n=1 Tax=Tanacetum coccineum TaxID=301880 RepID=A0ABQ5AFJ8_9ASTR